MTCRRPWSTPPAGGVPPPPPPPPADPPPAARGRARPAPPERPARTPMGVSACARNLASAGTGLAARRTALWITRTAPDRHASWSDAEATTPLGPDLRAPGRPVPPRAGRPERRARPDAEPGGPGRDARIAWRRSSTAHYVPTYVDRQPARAADRREGGAAPAGRSGDRLGRPARAGRLLLRRAAPMTASPSSRSPLVVGPHAVPAGAGAECSGCRTGSAPRRCGSARDPRGRAGPRHVRRDAPGARLAGGRGRPGHGHRRRADDHRADARYVAAHPGWLGVPLARAALELADEHSRSPAETRMRLIWTQHAGLPRPLVNCEVFSRTAGCSGWRTCSTWRPAWSGSTTAATTPAPAAEQRRVPRGRPA